MRNHNLSPRVSPKLRVTAKLIQALNLLKLATPALKEYLDKSISENPLLQASDLESLYSNIKTLIFSDHDRVSTTHLTASGEISDYAQNIESASINLHDHLLHQLKTSFLNDNELTIGEDIIECLLIQLKIKTMEHSLAYVIVKSFFKELARKNISLVAKKTGNSTDKLKEAMKIITSLSPKPGTVFSRDENLTVIPDAIITKHKNCLRVKLNEKELPSLNINLNYLKLLRDQNTSQEVKQFITERLKNAIWLKKAMEERRNNVLKVIHAIVKIQRDAILRGLSYLKPLTLTEIAKISSLHHSTVSRIVANTYASTPQCTIRIKDLFSGKYKLSDGSVISSKRILLKILDITLMGNKKTPLTDRAMADILRKNGIQISRRTIAKYRKKINIPSSFFRAPD